jgi:hypothetical protein
MTLVKYNMKEKYPYGEDQKMDKGNRIREKKRGGIRVSPQIITPELTRQPPAEKQTAPKKKLMDRRMMEMMMAMTVTVMKVTTKHRTRPVVMWWRVGAMHSL